MLKPYSLLLILLLYLGSCVKEDTSKSDKPDVNLRCSTLREPHLITSGTVSHSNITEDDIFHHMDLAMESMVKHKRYIKVILRPELGEFTIKMYDFESEEARKEKQLYLEHQSDTPIKLNTTALKTIHSTTDGYYASYLYGLLKKDIWNNLGLLSPCEQELIIFEFDGVWYIEDCC